MADYTLYIDPCWGTLSISGVGLAGPAWGVLSLASLWESAETRGSDVLLPGVAGVRARRRRRTATKHAFPFVIVGTVNRLGVEQANTYTGAQLNRAYLETNVCAPTGVGDGTRPAVLTLPSGATVSADVHVDGLKSVSLGPRGIIQCVLEISDPTGSLCTHE